MRILIAEDDASIAQLIRTTLERAGHRVDIATTGKIALHRLSHAEFDMFLVDSKLPDTDGSTLCRRVRTECARPESVVLMASANGLDVRAQAARADADECLPKPVTAANLLNVVKSATAKSQQRLVAAKAIPSGPAHPLEKTKSWTETRETIAKKLLECTSLELKPATLEQPSEDVRATLVMVDVEHQIELAVGLFVSRASGTQLVQAMLGNASVDDTLIREVLAELCNNLLGLMKINMRADNFPFTLSLPNKGNPPRFAELTSSLQASVAHGYRAGNVEVQALIGVRPTANRAMPVEKLTENMVLAESVLNEGGVLVLAAGTRLTATSANRLARHLPGRKVRVCVLDQVNAA